MVTLQQLRDFADGLLKQGVDSNTTVYLAVNRSLLHVETMDTDRDGDVILEAE